MIQSDRHPAPPGHPESAERMSLAVNELLKSDLIDNIEILTPEPVETNSVYKVHDSDYLERARSISACGGGFLDPDTYISQTSYNAAFETASAAVNAVNIIMNESYKRIFLAGRPPGHHAEYDRGMGFCVINNTAVAAEELIFTHNLNRVAIIDWDVHHGNGTQRSFYNRKDVFYISMHQFPFYPGSGATSDTGAGEGEGYTLNVPILADSGDDVFLSAFSGNVVSVLNDYRPEFIIIGAGFDAHRDDPLGGLNLSENAFGEMTAGLVEIADKYCDGRILSLFEGGYSPTANARSLYCHIKELIG